MHCHTHSPHMHAHSLVRVYNIQCPFPRLQDDATLASRGTDGTLRIWDLRNFRAPLKTFAGLPANYSTTNVCFSPDERLVLTGTAAPDPRGGGGGDAGGGSVVFVDRRELRVVRALGMPGHVAAVRWHDRINQILVGVGEPAAAAGGQGCNGAAGGGARRQGAGRGGRAREVEGCSPAAAAFRPCCRWPSGTTWVGPARRQQG